MKSIEEKKEQKKNQFDNGEKRRQNIEANLESTELFERK